MRTTAPNAVRTSVKLQLWSPIPVKTEKPSSMSPTRMSDLSKLQPFGPVFWIDVNFGRNGSSSSSSSLLLTHRTFFLWKTFPCSRKSAEGARRKEFLADAVRRSIGFRMLACTQQKGQRSGLRAGLSSAYRATPT